MITTAWGDCFRAMAPTAGLGNSIGSWRKDLTVGHDGESKGVERHVMTVTLDFVRSEGLCLVAPIQSRAIRESFRPGCCGY